MSLMTRTLALIAAALMATMATAQPVAPFSQAPTQRVVRWTARVEAAAAVSAGAPLEVLLDATIDRGWHLYAITQDGGGPQPLVIAPARGSPFRLVGAVIAPLPITAPDPNFTIDTQYHAEQARFYVPLVVPADAAGRTPLDLDVTWQTCTDRYCLPPATERVSLSLLVPGTGADATFIVPAAVVAPAVPFATVEDMAADTGAGTLGAYLGLAVLMGALSLLTPCVFPMVPITVSYFTGRAERHRGRAVSQALVYGAGIVLTFTGVGLVLALGFGASGLNQFAANPWLNLGIAALFIAFALNLFGVLELALPSRWLTRASALDVGADAGLRRDAGTLLMGLAFTLTSFTCTAPFLGTLLVVAAQGDWQWPLAGLLAFSTVFALPFVLLAWAPQVLAGLPRSGGWLLSIKATMGLLELAAALKFLSNVDLVWGWGVFTRDVVIALWIAIGVVLVIYLAGGLRLGRAPRLSRPGLPRWVTVAAALAMTVWLGTGLAGRRLGELEAFLPPGDPGGGEGGELAWIVNDYEGALSRATATNTLVMVDFTGYTCTNCRWMEANMFTVPEVSRELSRYVRLRLYTDGRGDEYLRFQNLQRDTFGTVALPYYAVLTPAGVPVVAFGGLTRDPDRFIAFLQRGLQ
jgi:thiol:disulfide interchange protein DsbD